MNGKSAIISGWVPFALSLSKGERRVFPQTANALRLAKTEIQAIQDAIQKVNSPNQKSTLSLVQHIN
jgi:hypothetical protein